MPSNAKYMSRYISDRYLRLKIEFIEWKGGECQECGYDKCYAALEFHHRDPDKKEASWSAIRKWSKARIRAELGKCDLLCSNCHREEHCVLDLLPTVLDRHNGRRRKRDRRCEECGETVNTGKRFCKPECSQKNRETTSWPDNLPSLVTKSSLRAMATKLGVSDKAVKKRLQNHHESNS